MHIFLRKTKLPAVGAYLISVFGCHFSWDYPAFTLSLLPHIVSIGRRWTARLGNFRGTKCTQGGAAICYSLHKGGQPCSPWREGLGTTQPEYHFYPFMPNWNPQESPLQPLIALQFLTGTFCLEAHFRPNQCFQPQLFQPRACGHTTPDDFYINIPGFSWPHAFVLLPGSLTLVLQSKALVSGCHVPAAAQGLNQSTHSRNAFSGLRCPAQLLPFP